MEYLESMPTEYAFVMLRPGALRRKKVRFIFNEIEKIGLCIRYYEKKELDSEFIYKLYSHLLNGSLPLDIFDRTMAENISGEVIGVIISGNKAIEKTRILVGPSNVSLAKEMYPIPIRALGDPNNNPDNLIHASDSVEHAIDEIESFFGMSMEQLEQKMWQSKRRGKKKY